MNRRALPLVLLVSLFALVGLAAPAQAAQLNVPGSYPTIQAAVDAASDGDTILVAPGSYYGATVTKAVEIKGQDGAIVNDGPLHASGLKFGFLFPGNGTGSGATISHFRFEIVDFPIFSRGANDVTVTQNVMINANQGVTNWAGSASYPGASFGKGWSITHNDLVDLRCDNGGGIGIFIGDYMGGTTATDSLVAHNTISGTLHVPVSGEFGGYNGSGIVLYSDYRYGGSGGEISYDRVIKNKVAIVSDTPSLVDIAAFEMTEAFDTPPAVWPDPPDIHDNAIGFNDFRGTAIQLAFTPEELDTVNAISRNFGENRGHGLQPKVFGPAR